jgi:hypothetical protein
MPIDSMLPGLDRLIDVCRRHSLPWKLSPPLASAPKLGDTLFGEPVDQQLVAIYHRLGAAEFGEFALYSPSSEEGGLVPQNEWLRERDEVQFRASLAFGWEPGFAFYYGTVPRLTDPPGLQPVVYTSAMEALFAVPVASSVDRFFDLYSRYLELVAVDPDYVESGMTRVNFPWSVQHLVTQDALLIAQVRMGRFDFLSNDYRDALEWLEHLRSSRP